MVDNNWILCLFIVFHNSLDTTKMSLWPLLIMFATINCYSDDTKIYLYGIVIGIEIWQLNRNLWELVFHLSWHSWMLILTNLKLPVFVFHLGIDNSHFPDTTTRTYSCQLIQLYPHPILKKPINMNTHTSAIYSLLAKVKSISGFNIILRKSYSLMDEFGNLSKLLHR